VNRRCPALITATRYDTTSFHANFLDPQVDNLVHISDEVCNARPLSDVSSVGSVRKDVGIAVLRFQPCLLDQAVVLQRKHCFPDRKMVTISEFGERCRYEDFAWLDVAAFPVGLTAIEGIILISFKVSLRP
jgi:hypothetical protein